MSKNDTDTEPPAIDPEACEPGTVPGWLNADGDPTGCVGDLANPEEVEDDVFIEFPDDVIFEAEPAPVDLPDGVVFTPGPLPIEHPDPAEEIPVVGEDAEIPVMETYAPPAYEESVEEPATWDGKELAETGIVGDVFLMLFIGFALVGIGILVYASHIKRSWKGK